MASFLNMYVPYPSFLIAERGTHRLCFSAAAAQGGSRRRVIGCPGGGDRFFFYFILPRSLFFWCHASFVLAADYDVGGRDPIQNQALPDAGSNLDAGVDEDASE